MTDDDLDLGPGARRATDAAARALRRARPFRLGIALTGVAAAVIAVGLTMPGSSPESVPAVGPAPTPIRTGSVPQGGAPPHMVLAAYPSCEAMLAALRRHAADHVGAYGQAYGQGGPVYNSMNVDGVRGPAAVAEPAAGAAGGSVAATPEHSSTNDQEIGVDEPDLVKTDGRRVVSVSGGVLRVVDAASHEVTGTLDLRVYAGAAAAQVLMAGDRVLVVLGGDEQVRYGPYPLGGTAIRPSGSTSTVLLVDIAATPTVVGTLRADGGYVDARMHDGTVRLVVDSAPRVTLPIEPGIRPSGDRAAAGRLLVRHAPLSAWLPTYATTDGGVTAEHHVPCGQVSHPATYSGAAMLTVYSIDLAAGLDDPHPVSIAADAGTVYATATSLYISSTAGTHTDLHRFDIHRPGTPRYLGSGTVPGYVDDSYSMSEYAGTLRVVTSAAATSVYVLDADTLRKLGSVGDLGRNERLHAVRFLGPLAYLVTYESVDPLFVIDLHDPAHPRRAGELTVTGYSDYLHPTDDGRLLGVGESVNQEQRVTGLQVSLFDVSRADDPTRLDRVTRSHTPSETPIDPHAFLYWPDTRTAVIPIDSWEPSQSGAAVVLHVGRDGLRVEGTIRNPGVTALDGYTGGGIERTLVIGDRLWTMSAAGLLVSDLHSLDRRGWVGFA
jgi:uncharacterized secreted protein with C-terminal beta-propeller domain